jgi:probable rRNA maturation factor
MSVSPIRFFFEGVPDSIRNKRKHQAWIREVIQLEGHIPGPVNFIFISDTELLKMNQLYLKHDTFTDVITFPLSDPSSPQSPVEGEIYISLERVRENAGRFTVPFTEEIRRVMVHGVLHLMGYTDEKPRDRLKMKEKEDLYLSLPSIQQ